MHVTLEVPERFFPHVDAEVLAQQMKLYAALVLYQADHLSMAAACELAGVDRYTFMAECKRYGIATVRYDEHELIADLNALRELEGEC